MKLINLLLLFFTMLLLTACEDEPNWISHSWLCSVNADGSGFRKIKQYSIPTYFSDMYVTHDGKLLFYGDRLWLSDADTINAVPITPENLILNKPYRISQNADGSKLYFAANQNIYQLTYPGLQLTQLTHETVRTLRNPILSDLGNYLTYTSRGNGSELLEMLNLATSDTTRIPTGFRTNNNFIYQERNKQLYFEAGLLYSMKLDGTERTVLDSIAIIAYANALYSFSADKRYFIRHAIKHTPIRDVIYIRNLETGSTQQLQADIDGSDYILAKTSHQTNKVFYANRNYDLAMYDLDTGLETILFYATNQRRVDSYYAIAPTWQGDKVYFFCDLGERIP